MNRNWTPLRRAAGAAILTALAAAGPAAAQAPPTITLKAPASRGYGKPLKLSGAVTPARRAAGPGDRDPAGRGAAGRSRPARPAPTGRSP